MIQRPRRKSIDCIMFQNSLLDQNEESNDEK